MREIRAGLLAIEPEQARALLTVTGGRTVYELRGISCLPIELVEPMRKGIAVTRSFGKPILEWENMREGVATYAARAAEKMRHHQVAAVHASVFLHTSAFNGGPRYSNAATAVFPKATNDTGEVVAMAVRLGERIWRPGFRYAKAGIMIAELLPETARQPALWSEFDRERRAKLWRVVDALDVEKGRGTVRVRSTGP